jgi:hypothetical protein
VSGVGFGDEDVVWEGDGFGVDIVVLDAAVRVR